MPPGGDRSSMKASGDRDSRAKPGEAALRPEGFVTTRWSVVRAAGVGAGSTGREALSELCQTYWYPLYAFLRRRGHQPEEAQDLTQAFFTHLLEGRVLSAADAARGRFRSFLLQSLKNFLSTERRRRFAQKRGGGRPMLSLDYQSGEDRYRLEPADPLTPERLFDRRWALTLLEQGLAELRREYETSGRGALFAALESHLEGRPGTTAYAELGSRLGMSEGAVKAAAHRLRRRYRELLRRAIAETVSTPEDIEDELRDLLNALS